MSNNPLLPRLFPRALWQSPATALWLLTAATLLWFDTLWCMATTFTAFSMPELWINTLLLSLLLSAPALLFDGRRTQVAVIILTALWMEANLLYSRTYFSAIPAGSYLLAGNLADFTASVTDSLRAADLGFLLIIALAVIAVRRGRKTPPRRFSWRAAAVYALYIVIAAAISFGLNSRRGGFLRTWSVLENANYHSCRVPMFTVAGSLIHDAMTTARQTTDADREFLREWIAATPAMPDTTVAGADNIVLILCESLESWVIGLEAEGKQVTPFLTQLVADSTTFYAPNVVTQVADGRSIDAQLLINAGLLPPERGVYSMNAVGHDYPTLNRALAQSRGARSYLLTVDKEITWNQGAVARAFGIDTILSRDSWVNDERVGSRKKLGDRSFMHQAAAKMRSGEIWPEGENAFVQLVTYSGHNPFILPEALDSLRLTGDYPKVVADYMTMARYTDSAIREIVSYLRTRPDFGRTLVVITGDHEGLASYRAEAAEQCPFVDPRQHTPLIVLNAPVGGRFDAPMGQVDIYSTILQMAGLSGYSWKGAGMSAIDSRFPGVAIGSQHNVEGDTTAVSPDLLRRLRTARRASGLIVNS